MTRPALSEEDIFQVARRIETGAGRAAYLNQACGGNAALREQVEELLRAYDASQSFLEASPAAAMAAEMVMAPTVDQPVTERVGAQIGPYKLLQQVGEGGMGVVYMAEQHEPIRRRVALKIIKPGMDTRQVIARFEAERQALSLMDHHNIARVLDAGTTDSGRPYFVMELVNGIPVTQFCDEQHLTARERLELFIPICQAVQHAHQKGIIHRDIKPSNILVALYDGRPVPKAIDFGVAKATGGQLTEKTMFTGLGQIIGTLEYMSPEQAQRNQLDIDTRSDVYSLGVVLYELLTGDTPFDKQRLRSAALEELLRIIREEEPPKPSTKLSGSDTLPSVAANRKIEPAKLSALIRGELDWIVMKALEKDRARRYETANGLAHDIQRYLNDEPVAACPPSAAYRFRKFTRRNKAAMVTVGLVAAALIVGLVGTTWQAIRATRAEDAAIAERDEKEAARREALASAEQARSAAEAEAQQRQQAKAAEKKAADEAAVAKAVNEFLKDDLLRLADAGEQMAAKMEPDPNVKLTTLLDRAQAKVDERFADLPQVRAEVQATLASAFYSIGRYTEAARLGNEVRQYFESTLGTEHPKTLEALSDLGVAYMALGELVQAEPLLKMALETTRRVEGSTHPNTFKFMIYLGRLYSQQARYVEAESLYTQSLEISRRELGPEHPETLTSMNNLAEVYVSQGRYAEAESLCTEVLEIRRRVQGPEYPATLSSMSTLAGIYLDQARYAEAESLCIQCLELSRRVLGAEHRDTLGWMHTLVSVYLHQARYGEAESLCTEVLEIRRRVLGPEHPDTLASMNNLAVLYRHQRRYAEAEPLHIECVEISRRVLGPEHPNTLTSMQNLAEVYMELNKPDQSIPLYEQTLRLRVKVQGEKHPDTLRTKAGLGKTYKDAGRLVEALPLLEEAYRASQQHRTLSWVAGQLSDAYVKAGKLAEAGALTKEQLESDRAALPEGSPQLAGVLDRSGLQLLQLSAWNDAEPILRECLAIREHLEPDAWTTFSTKSMLGEALTGQQKYAEAESLLVQGYEGLRRQEATIPDDGKYNLGNAFVRLVEYWLTRGKLQEAAVYAQALRPEWALGYLDTCWRNQPDGAPVEAFSALLQPALALQDLEVDFQHAAWLAATGHIDEYQSFVRQLWERPRGRSNLRHEYLLARAATLAETTAPRAADVLQAAQTAASAPVSWHLFALGMAQVRSGNHAGALESFQKSRAQGWCLGLCDLGQALALHRLGRDDEARAAYERGRQWWVDQHIDGVSPQHPHDRVHGRLLLRELERQLPPKDARQP